MAQEILAEHIERCDPTVHISDIESAVAEFFGVTSSAIHSSKKDRTVHWRDISACIWRESIRRCQSRRLAGCQAIRTTQLFWWRAKKSKNKSPSTLNSTGRDRPATGSARQKPFSNNSKRPSDSKTPDIRRKSRLGTRAAQDGRQVMFS